MLPAAAAPVTAPVISSARRDTPPFFAFPVSMPSSLVICPIPPSLRGPDAAAP
jgi:hypothetical protein